MERAAGTAPLGTRRTSTAARTLLAVSPHVDEIEWGNRYDDDPATEHLRLFAGLAAGVDAMHHNKIAHCDIKAATCAG